MKEKKKKKHHRVLWTILIILGVVVVLPVSLIYGFCYDGSTGDFTVDTNYKVENMYPAIMYDAFADTNTTGKMKLNLQQADLSNIINNAFLGALPEQAKMFLKKAYLEMFNQDGQMKYNFYLDVEVPVVFKTRLILGLSLKEEKMEIGETNDKYLIFTIDEIKIARTPNLINLTYDLITQNFLKQETIQGLFQSMGLTVTVDLEHKMVYYKESQLVKDLQSKVSLGDFGPCFMSIADHLITNEHFAVSIVDKKYTSNQVDFNCAHTSSYATQSDNYKITSIDNSSNYTKTKTVIENSKISKDDESKMFSYLARGYSKSSTEIQEWVDDKDFSSIDIPDVTTYNGQLNIGTSGDLIQTLSDNITAEQLTAGTLADVDENILSDFMKTNNIVGQGMFFRNPADKDSNYNARYLVIDNCYSNIINEHLYITLGVNFNGFETLVTVITDQVPNTENYCASYKVSNVYLGNEALSETTYSSFFTLIKKSLASDFISFDDDNKQFDLNFSSVITNISDPVKRAAVEAAMVGKHTVVTTTGSSLTDTGKIHIAIEND